MNRIKGLIVKDLLQLKSYRKTLVTFIAVFIAVSFLDTNKESIETTIILMMTLGLGMFSIATFNYDEMAKADRYILTLPVNRKDIVLSKYILVVISTFVGAILGIILSVGMTYAIYQEIPEMMYLMSLAMGGIFGLGVVNAIQIPCIFKYGAEKGRIQRFIALAVICLMFYGIFYLFQRFNIHIEIQSTIDMVKNYSVIILIPTVLILYYVSYKISYMIYRKKEL